MRLTMRLALVLLFALPGAVGAQSSPPANVGDNANIIPIYQSADPPALDDYLRGNLLGQRCNEASIGISSSSESAWRVPHSRETGSPCAGFAPFSRRFVPAETFKSGRFLSFTSSPGSGYNGCGNFPGASSPTDSLTMW